MRLSESGVSVTPDAREENSQSQSLSRNVPESKQNFSFPEAFSRLVNYKSVGQSCIRMEVFKLSKVLFESWFLPPHSLLTISCGGHERGHRHILGLLTVDTVL